MVRVIGERVVELASKTKIVLFNCQIHHDLFTISITSYRIHLINYFAVMSCIKAICKEED